MANPTPLLKLRNLIAVKGLRKGDRLPAERAVCEQLNVSRGALRQALAVLDASGEVSRHVGRGTFVGNLPRTPIALADVTNPLEVTEARLNIEPRLAALAALRGTGQEFQNLARILALGVATDDVLESQELNDELHQAIANASKNQLLIAAFEMIFHARAVTNWGKLRPFTTTAAELNVLWLEHGKIVSAIQSRDAQLAEELMAAHIAHVQDEIDLRRWPAKPVGTMARQR